MKDFLHCRSIKNLFFPFLSLLLFISCSKEPINGNLDGQWEVENVVPLPTSIIIKERLFYNFSLHVCMLSYYGGTLGFASMNYQGDTLTLNFKDEAPDGDLKALPQYGILHNPVTFKVEFTDSHHLILKNSESTVFLVKH